uniref:hypothetical protein n=1 Tax=uncultured Acinetobacter sp. TaxID=165433 RepID=UPI002620E480|nr:hypothetical protein [uncultured Acinetobacter sp.]
MTPFFMYRKIDDFYVISNGKYYATATPKQTVDFGVAHIKNWEKFYKVSLQRYIENLGTIGESK